MPIKSILAIVSPPQDAELALSWAEALAAADDARVDAAFVDEDWTRTGYGPYVGYGDPSILDQIAERARHLREAAESAFDERKAEAPKGRFGRFLPVGRIDERSLAARAGTVDLTVALLPGEGDEASVREETLGAAVIDGGGVVLAPPANLDVKDRFAHVALAWDGGREAARAMRAGLPFLTRADRVSILTLDERERGLRLLPEADAFLAAHGVRAKSELRPASTFAQGRHLFEEAAALAPDLLIMGAYSRAQWFEEVFGGATQHGVRSAGMPLLLSH